MANPAPAAGVINAPNTHPPVLTAPAPATAAPATPTIDPHAVTAPIVPHAVTAPPVDPHAVAPHAQSIVDSVSAHLGFSPWWFVLVMLAVVGGALIGKQKALRTGVNPNRGMIDGLRNGALYSSALLGVVSLFDSWFGFYFIFSMAIVIGGTLVGGAKNFHQEVDQSKSWAGAKHGLLNALLAVTTIDSIWVVGFGHTFLALVFGFLAGVVTTAVVSKRANALVSSLTSDFVGVLRSEGSEFGIWGAFGAVTLAAVMFGAFGAVTAIVLSLIAGAAGGYLASLGEVTAEAAPAEAAPAAEATEETRELEIHELGGEHHEG